MTIAGFVFRLIQISVKSSVTAFFFKLYYLRSSTFGLGYVVDANGIVETV